MIKIALSMLVLVGMSMAVEVGKIPSSLSLSGSNGGKVDGSAWKSSSLKGKVSLVFYVDPDKKDVNQAFTKALKKEHFESSKFSSIAIINMAATWMPNVALDALLKSKQKEFPRTLYVKDKKSVLVKKWGLADDNSDILLFNKEGKLLFKKFGKLSKSDIAKVIATIKDNL